MWLWMGQPPASPSHLQGRPLGHMLPGQPFSEIATGYCLFLGRPPPRPYLAWLHLMTIRYISEGMKASHAVRHQNPHCVACPSQQVSPSPPGISLWLRALCSQVSDMTKRTEDKHVDKSLSILLYTRKSSDWNVKQNNLANVKEMVSVETDMCTLIRILYTVESSGFLNFPSAETL